MSSFPGQPWRGPSLAPSWDETFGERDIIWPIGRTKFSISRSLQASQSPLYALIVITWSTMSPIVISKAGFVRGLRGQNTCTPLIVPSIVFNGCRYVLVLMEPWSSCGFGCFFESTKLCNYAVMMNVCSMKWAQWRGFRSNLIAWKILKLLYRHSVPLWVFEKSA